MKRFCFVAMALLMMASFGAAEVIVNGGTAQAQVAAYEFFGTDGATISIKGLAWHIKPDLKLNDYLTFELPTDCFEWTADGGYHLFIPTNGVWTRSSDGDATPNFSFVEKKLVGSVWSIRFRVVDDSGPSMLETCNTWYVTTDQGWEGQTLADRPLGTNTIDVDVKGCDCIQAGCCSDPYDYKVRAWIDDGIYDAPLPGTNSYADFLSVVYYYYLDFVGCTNGKVMIDPENNLLTFIEDPIPPYPGTDTALKAVTQLGIAVCKADFVPTISSDDYFEVTIKGDWSGVKKLTWYGTPITTFATDPVFKVPATDAFVGGLHDIIWEVKGTVELFPRQFSVQGQFVPDDPAVLCAHPLPHYTTTCGFGPWCLMEWDILGAMFRSPWIVTAVDAPDQLVTALVMANHSEQTVRIQLWAYRQDGESKGPIEIGSVGPRRSRSWGLAVVLNDLGWDPPVITTFINETCKFYIYGYAWGKMEHLFGEILYSVEAKNTNILLQWYQGGDWKGATDWIY